MAIPSETKRILSIVNRNYRTKIKENLFSKFSCNCIAYSLSPTILFLLFYVLVYFVGDLINNNFENILSHHSLWSYQWNIFWKYVSLRKMPLFSSLNEASHVNVISNFWTLTLRWYCILYKAWDFRKNRTVSFCFYNFFPFFRSRLCTKVEDEKKVLIMNI